MAERITAGQQLSRILQLLPQAARKDGATLAELARVTNASEEEVVRDLQEVYTRAFYQPAGSVDDVQITIDATSVSVWTTGEFRRPIRLGPEESIATALALRVLAAGNADSAEAMLSLADRLESSLLDPRAIGETRHFGVHPEALSAGGLHETLGLGARDRYSCRIEYLKPGATDPEERVIDPYALVQSGGRWYVIARCHRHRDVRVFRLDRVLRAGKEESSFEVPPDFDPTAYIAEGRVFRGQDLETATVRYSARIARRIAEAGPVTPLDDGTVIVRYAVADHGWLVRHVLEHGVDAVLLDPPAIRQLVVEAARGLLEDGVDGGAPRSN